MSLPIEFNSTKSRVKWSFNWEKIERELKRPGWIKLNLPYNMHSGVTSQVQKVYSIFFLHPPHSLGTWPTYTLKRFLNEIMMIIISPWDLAPLIILLHQAGVHLDEHRKDRVSWGNMSVSLLVTGQGGVRVYLPVPGPVTSIAILLYESAIKCTNFTNFYP